MKNKKLFFTSLLIFISSLLYSQRITETLLHLEYNEETETLDVVEKKITYYLQKSTKVECKHTEAGLPLDSDGYPIVILKPEQRLIQQEDSTTSQEQVRTPISSKNNHLDFFYGICVGLGIALSMYAAYRFIKWQLKHTIH